MNNALFLGLGSNLGDRIQELASGINLLERCFGPLLGISHVFETEPWQVDHSTAYLNLVVVFSACCTPLEALQITQEVEKAMGRKEKGLLKPRTIDIDILSLGNLVFQHELLVLPHPSLTRRRFVLQPLVHVCPGWIHPVSGWSAEKLLEVCSDTSGIFSFCSGDELLGSR
jgi:2-amino-4-hydroxy-6-hydroxymethyldihydropteridine diphosphokinase